MKTPLSRRDGGPKPKMGKMHRKPSRPYGVPTLHPNKLLEALKTALTPGPAGWPSAGGENI